MNVPKGRRLNPNWCHTLDFDMYLWKKIVILKGPMDSQRTPQGVPCKWTAGLIFTETQSKRGQYFSLQNCWKVVRRVGLACQMTMPKVPKPWWSRPEMNCLSKNDERVVRLHQNSSSWCRLQTKLTQLWNCKIASWNMFTQFKALLKMFLNKILHL